MKTVKFPSRPAWRGEGPNVLVLRGEIDLHVSPAVAKSLRAILVDRPGRVIVDLSHVKYIESSGLAVLIEGLQDARDYGGELVLAGLQESVRDIFEIAHLTMSFGSFLTSNRRSS